MAFTLGDILGTGGESSPSPEPERPTICPTGKTPLCKREARQLAQRVNRTQRTNMKAFRCGWCERYHLGLRRGAIY